MWTLPTIVLSHGAFADSSSWNGVIKRLRESDFPVIAAPNALRGPIADGDALRSLLDTIEGRIVLVGHSYGGTVISRAAAGLDRVAALVYVAGFAPENGESVGDIAGKFTGSTLGETLIARQLSDGSVDLYIDPGKFHDQVAADLPVADAELAALTQRPISNIAIEQPFAAEPPAWKTTPSWFVFGDADKNIPLQTHRWMADRAVATRVLEIPRASHAIPISHPDEVAYLIADAAASVTR
ncbi:alpha/beta fold hydrolase [Herbiconiux daphne]|uniref:Alpha/beta hydrolase n=1 Tax=Herbiconiux daphne TaxID=2970914 RepID=A0ABT2H553_9MICO|nr:alpha/beta hydrolase [Herbiconiux daphne]MCS5735069.1 alpha/beta hydrolase [Herbiconiux daphne]